MSAHVERTQTYLLIFLGLMVLTATTVWVAFQDLGVFNNVAALTIAVAKATLVVLFFMHVRHSTRLTKLVVMAGLFWLMLLFLFTLADYMTRGWLGVPGK